MNNNPVLNESDKALGTWREKEKTALELLQIVGELRFDKSVELVLFRRDIYDSRASEVINDHLFAKNYVKKPISISTSLDLAYAISRLNLPPSKIDIGKLGADWITEGKDYSNIDEFVGKKLSYLGNDPEEIQPKDVVLYGFGRIGRLAARRLISMTGRGEQLRLKAIVVRPKLNDRKLELQKRASLFRKDSVHGKFRGTINIDADSETFIINGNRIKVIFAKTREEINYKAYGINDAMIIDNTGVWRDKEGLSGHLRPGASQVLFTAPGAGIPNIVHGVNQHILKDENVLCAASCTTNAIVPILKVVEDNFGIEKGHIESVHAYTSAQNLLDNFHKKPRRGRAAAINMVITSTGAAKAVAKVLPDLAGKLTGNAVRVPTADVSLAIINLSLNRETSVEEMNKVMEEASLHGALVEQIKYSTSFDFVSSDAIGTTHTSIFDAPSTIVSADGKSVTLYVWYDNEYGYTCQVLRLAKHIAQVRRPHFY